MTTSKIQVVISGGITTQAIPIPPVTTSHKLSGHAVSLDNQGKYHLTTETTKIDDNKKQISNLKEIII